MATPSYKIVPDQEELDAIERDLKFYPSTNKDPKVLTPEQIEHYNREGYIHPISIFSAGEIGEIRSYFDELLERVIAEGGDSYSISSAHLKHGKVWDMLHDQRIVDCVSDILGQNVVGWGSHFFCKMPHDGKTVAWHQDSSYWPLTPTKALTVWLAIDDVDAENGPMKFISGSHHVGHLTYRPSSSHEHNVLNQTIDNPEQYGAVIENHLQAGQISMHSDLLLHGSDANDSDRRRCALTLRYAAADVKAHLGWNGKGVFVRGEDKSGHWANNPRPENE
ncbi:phytanoyl-CoA dioxygenase family protein [uncultured Rubinisphaera sp.]|uniref:phytanoyl-CoA dioxygenase family protein n=1 Tax=uncultured Rubinisphaera sp. TaxID=1678686 RepID=UPI0030D7DA1F|tara:strand:- start:308 stop:1141 length:834 start_codon:yes stop_codon:yes gene_type:complete